MAERDINRDINREMHRKVIPNYPLCGQRVQVEIVIARSREMNMTFTCWGKSYDFYITAMRSGGFSRIARLIITYYSDPEHFHRASIANVEEARALFGEIVDPDTQNFNCTHVQKRNCQFRLCFDILAQLQQIFEEHQRHILDYAVWYRENKAGPDPSYDDQVMLLTCHCIVHADFMSNVSFKLASFPRAPVTALDYNDES